MPVTAYLRLPFSAGDTASYLSACQQRLQEYAAENLPDLGPPVLFVEEASARKRPFRQRPVARKLQRQLHAGDVVLILDSGRAWKGWREMFDTLDLWRSRSIHYRLLDLAVSSDSEEGQWALALMRAFVDAQGRRVAEASREARSNRRPGAARNQFPGYPMKLVGPENRRRAVVCQHTRRVGKRVVELRNAGLSWDAIYFQLLRDKVQTRDGGEWSRTSLQDIHAAEVALQAKEQASTPAESSPQT